jgi:uncharacterized UPF0160 family protein
MKIVTHNGRFHVDDVFAVATALMVYPGAEVVRTRDEKVIESADIAIDVGLVCDSTRKRFDHHQGGGAGGRENGMPYSSFGLVWREWGRELAGEEESKIIDQKLVCPIDANDNAISISKNKFPGIREYTIYDVITAYGDEDGFSEEALLERFLEAVEMAKSILRREINVARREISDTKEVLGVVERLQNKRLVVLDKNLLWLKALASVPETLYVVYPRKDGTWGVQTVSKDINNSFFEARKPFPKSWGGKTDSELAQITGIDDAKFCHTKLYLSVAKTKEGAIALAKKALDA